MAGDRWTSGPLYDSFMGRWSRLVAAAFVARLGVPPGASWVDVGCGTGALSAAILASAEPSAVQGLDPSPAFVEHAREALADPRFTAAVADAEHLPVDDASRDCVVSGLALNFVPDPARAVAEARRSVRSHGTVASYVWDYAEGMGMLRVFWDAVVALDPSAAALDEGPRFLICRPAALQGLFEQAGLREVAVTALEVPQTFRDFDDYWDPFLGGQGPAAGYCASLTAEGRDALRDLLRRRLPQDPDGTIRLTARAWMVAGTAP